jgi:hypothetical protein
LVFAHAHAEVFQRALQWFLIYAHHTMVYYGVLLMWTEYRFKPLL